MPFLVFLNQLFPCKNLPLRTVHRFPEIKHHKRSWIFLLGVEIQVGGHPFLQKTLLRWQFLFDKNGRKLHQNRETLLAHRQLNDEICKAHGLQVLEAPEKYPKKKRMKPGEYQAGLRADSWKLDLIQAINEALEYAVDRESFIENMEYEGYEVTWTDTRKHITFTCPNGRKCRDSSLHDETFLKENLEALFAYRRAVGFCPGSVEPDEGWIGELTSGLIQLGRAVERSDDLPPIPTPPTWTDSKQRRREAIKKMAMGQKFSGSQQWEQSM